MKLKIVANGVTMGENLTALKAVNMLCGIMQGWNLAESLQLDLFYFNDIVNTWKRENGFNLKGVK